ncbi:hypothetical protein [Chromobacterium sp. ATCC 53434]|uniref:hypothetical protein n=1 Tax=Chromobacterium sp. (strain ATCC 53434 / SC 14030) TaxID=2059672 RepID=UPI00130546F9|nr:hypothetical protein [Chromobacterium sp. ATCC 53434]
MANIKTLLPFSADRRAFRSFGHAIVAERGLVAVAPLHALDGSLLGLVDGCPVPWGEACAVIDADVPGAEVELDNQDFTDVVARLATVAVSGWRMAALPALRAVLFAHDSGLRVAIAADLALAGATPAYR